MTPTQHRLRRAFTAYDCTYLQRALQDWLSRPEAAPPPRARRGRPPFLLDDGITTADLGTFLRSPSPSAAAYFLWEKEYTTDRVNTRTVRRACARLLRGEHPHFLNTFGLWLLAGRLRTRARARPHRRGPVRGNLWQGMPERARRTLIQAMLRTARKALTARRLTRPSPS